MATHETKKLMTLQGGRGIAAFMVLLYHANGAFGFGGRQTLGHVFSFGFAGLDYFFVPSGFHYCLVLAVRIANPCGCRNHSNEVLPVSGAM